jgi:hypothetical protein
MVKHGVPQAEADLYVRGRIGPGRALAVMREPARKADGQGDARFGECADRLGNPPETVVPDFLYNVSALVGNGGAWPGRQAKGRSMLPCPGLVLRSSAYWLGVTAFSRRSGWRS